MDFEGDARGQPPKPPSIQLWRSVRAGGDTKSPKLDFQRFRAAIDLEAATGKAAAWRLDSVVPWMPSKTTGVPQARMSLTFTAHFAGDMSVRVVRWATDALSVEPTLTAIATV
jgi:hypothetical protein